MRIKAIFLIGTSLCCAAQPGGSSASVKTVPPFGYVLDHNIHALRPILGIPGAALIGAPLDLGFSIRQAAISSVRGYALAISDDVQLQPKLVRLTGPLSIVAVPIAGRAQAVYVSPLGTAAAIVTTDGSLAVLTELSGVNPRVDQLVIGHIPEALAVSDDGGFVLLVSSNAKELILVRRDGSRTIIPAPGSISTLAFQPSGHAALVAGKDNAVWLVQPTTQYPGFLQVAGPDDGIRAPAALVFTLDGSRAAIANHGNGTVTVVNLQDGKKASVGCSCQPIRLEPLASAGWFRITELAEQPLFMVDTKSQRVLFVPSIPWDESPFGPTR